MPSGRRIGGLLPAYPEPALLPDGVEPLACSVQAPAALARRLQQIGVVADAEAGAALQPALRPGQRLVSRDGALWRWDGYGSAAGAASPASLRLRQRAQLEALRPQLAAAEAARAEALAQHEAAGAAAGAAQADERSARDRQRAAQAALRPQPPGARRLAGPARSQRSQAGGAGRGARRARRRNSPRPSRAPPRSRPNWRRCPTTAPINAGWTIFAPAWRGCGRRRWSARAASTLCCAKPPAGPAVCRRSRPRSPRGAAAWTGIRRQIETFELRQREGEAALAALQAMPAQLAARRGALLERTGVAEAARRDAADRLAEAETLLAQADRTLRAAEKALGDGREDRVRAEAALEQAEQAALAVSQSIAERLDASPAELPSSSAMERARHRGGTGSSTSLPTSGGSNGCAASAS